MVIDPLVVFVIVNWNGYSDTIRCLDSLKKVKYKNYKVIVIDNGSAGQDAEKIKTYYGAFVDVIETKKNLGFAFANNLGIEKGLAFGAEYIFLLNNDTIIHEEILNNLLKCFCEEPNAGIVGPKMYFMDRGNKIWSAGGKINWFFGHWMRGYNKEDCSRYNDRCEVDFIAGAGMLIKSMVFKKVGLIPTEYFLQWEDIDFCTRANINGFKCLYEPKAILWHKASASYKTARQKYVQVTLGIRNRIIFRKKYLSKGKFILFTLIFVMIITPAHFLWYFLVYKDFKRLRYFMQGVIMAYTKSDVYDLKQYFTNYN